MTPLPPDSLVFKLTAGAQIPCSAGAVQFELAGDAAAFVDRELLRNAAAAVLHYFGTEMKRPSVSAEEFSAALEKVLHGFGLTNISASLAPAAEPPRVGEADLCALAGDGLELVFFQRLRDELRRQLEPAPRVIRFHGLRDCVKQLAGAKRWSHRCQNLNDQIVDYLRTSLSAEPIGKPCGLVVV